MKCPVGDMDLYKGLELCSLGTVLGEADSWTEPGLRRTAEEESPSGGHAIYTC